jgi:putative membrane protein
LGITITAARKKVGIAGERVMMGTFDMGDMMDWGGWGWPFMGLMMIGIWILFVVVAIVVYFDAEKRGMNGLLWLVLLLIPMFAVVVLIVYLVVRESGARIRTGDKSAGALLDERYARGEISRDEYLRMREDLGGGRPPEMQGPVNKA